MHEQPTIRADKCTELVPVMCCIVTYQGHIIAVTTYAVSQYFPSLAMLHTLGKEAYSSLCYMQRTATGTHVPYWIIQCYLPPGRGDIPAFTPAN